MKKIVVIGLILSVLATGCTMTPPTDSSPTTTSTAPSGTTVTSESTVSTTATTTDETAYTAFTTETVTEPSSSAAPTTVTSTRRSSTATTTKRVTTTTRTTAQPTNETTVRKTTTTRTTTTAKPTTTTATNTGGAVAEYNRRVLELVNEERAAEGLAPLSYRSDLQPYADIRAEEIIKSFSHTRPNGTSCFTVLTDAGVHYRGLGENIAYGYRTPEDVVEGWMNSSGHRANILGDFNGLVVGFNDYHWVQLFIKA